jgi:hypothetical protein
MNSVSFFYWLQGSFECTANFQPASAIEVIKRHLEMVFENKGSDDKAAPPYHFCNFLDGVISSNGNLDCVKERLDSVFEHIDKSYPNAEELVEIHNRQTVVDGYQPTSTGGYHGMSSSQVFGC